MGSFPGTAGIRVGWLVEMAVSGRVGARQIVFAPVIRSRAVWQATSKTERRASGVLCRNIANRYAEGRPAISLFRSSSMSFGACIPLSGSVNGD